MLQTSLLLMKSLNKTKTPIFLICSVFFVSKGNLFDVYFTIRGRLITPFIPGSMPVGLNIRIRHSFTDL